MKQIQPDGWERARGYSHGIIGEGHVLAVAGQIGWNPRTHVFEAKDFVGQVRQALQNVATVLEAAGTGPHHVVRLTWYITDREAYLRSTRELGAAYREVFSDPENNLGWHKGFFDNFRGGFVPAPGASALALIGLGVAARRRRR